jgi:hypothetical protein
VDALEKASSSFADSSQNAISKFRRFFTNAFLDYPRQHALNVFLGMFVLIIFCAIFSFQVHSHTL